MTPELILMGQAIVSIGFAVPTDVLKEHHRRLLTGTSLSSYISGSSSKKD
jgi:hypothetical protein